KSNDTYKAVPVKSVHFEYDYSLCLNTPDNNKQPDPDMPNTPNAGGKLTLKKVYFSYRNSCKSILSPYEFVYGNTPNYQHRAYDRWGTFKSHDAEIDNIDFPYAVQDNATADANVEAWNLKTIIMPSGAAIPVD